MIFNFILLIRCESNGIFKKYFNENIVEFDVSGSSKQYINGSLQLTKPEYAIYQWDKGYDWCSTCEQSYDKHPYITFSLKSKKIKFNKYYIRAGCCYGNCCCEDDSNRYCADCCLYSWSLQISNDNRIWKDVHKIEKDNHMRRCNEKTYDLDSSYEARFVCVIQNEPCPGNPPCIAINKFEIFGDVLTDDSQEDFVSFHDDDDDVSIIGHISKNMQK